MSPRSSKANKGANSHEGSPSKPQNAMPPTRALREVRIYKESEDERLGIRFVRDDDGFDREAWGRDDAVTPIVAALDPKGEAARAGLEIDDMVLSINGQTGALFFWQAVPAARASPLSAALARPCPTVAGLSNTE